MASTLLQDSINSCEPPLESCARLSASCSSVEVPSSRKSCHRRRVSWPDEMEYPSKNLEEICPVEFWDRKPTYTSYPLKHKSLTYSGDLEDETTCIDVVRSVFTYMTSMMSSYYSQAIKL